MTPIQSVNVKLFSGHRILGLGFLLAGIFSLVSPLIINEFENGSRSLLTGINFTVFGLLICSLYRGTQVDTNEKRFKAFKSILGIKWGEWQALPALEGLYLVSHTEENSNLPNGITPTLSGKTTDYYVLALSKENQPVFSLNFNNEDKAREAGKALADGLEVVFID